LLEALETPQQCCSREYNVFAEAMTEAPADGFRAQLLCRQTRGLLLPRALSQNIVIHSQSVKVQGSSEISDT